MLTRPDTVFTELGTKTIEHGLADPLLSEFYEAVMSARPEEVQQKLKPFLPHLSLCSDKMSSDAPPPIFYVGGKCGQRELFGEDWATPTGTGPALRTPDPQLELASAEGYRHALSGTPYYGYARTLVDVNGGKFEVAFERLIIAMRPSLKSDYRFCAYLGIIQDLHRKF
ncbi:hypothetical protein [Roseibium salinum]|uniref:Uncharacterized protein n=1 Tax=Roseibium salinum TaxID=1604349 RepID=A0ABT3R111_9HYPH|nr:hypothetical protein [Roseibium sp. DSM 29163]MCX2722908.1 hypothetical protein [Roseibium sp. DSM 29163]